MGTPISSTIRNRCPKRNWPSRCADAYFIGIRSATELTARIIESAPRLIGVGCFCIGTNQVDLDCAQERGIPVFNAPFSNTRSVAELVLAEIILLMRGSRSGARPRIAADGSRPPPDRTRCAAKRLGIVGYGHIGTQVGLLAESLGMQVMYYDIETKLALGNARPVPSLDELLPAADVVTLHVPETPADVSHDRRRATRADEARGATDQRRARHDGGYRRAGQRRCATEHLAGAARGRLPRRAEDRAMTSLFLRCAASIT